MTDTPRVPSEATTGTPPDPEALADAATADTPVAGSGPTPSPEVPPAETIEAAGDTEAAEGTVPTEGMAGTEGAGEPDSPATAGPGEATAAAPAEPAEPAGAAEAAGPAEASEASEASEAAPADAATAAAPDDTPVAGAPPARTDLSPAACAALLTEHFPALFGGAPRPLKLRIQADIQVRAPGVFTRKALSVFLHRYTTSNAYLNALVKAPQRVDLDGAEAGEIADEHRAAATEELARRRAVHETRRREMRAAENAARRAAPAARLPGVEGNAEADAAPQEGAAQLAGADGANANAAAVGQTQRPAREAGREGAPTGRRDAQAHGRGERQPDASA